MSNGFKGRGVDWEKKQPVSWFLRCNKEKLLSFSWQQMSANQTLNWAHIPLPPSKVFFAGWKGESITSQCWESKIWQKKRQSVPFLTSIWGPLPSLKWKDKQPSTWKEELSKERCTETGTRCSRNDQEAHPSSDELERALYYTPD